MNNYIYIYNYAKKEVKAAATNASAGDKGPTKCHKTLEKYIRVAYIYVTQ